MKMCDKSYSKYVHLVTPNDQVKELQTIIRDSTTSTSDFVFYADRLIRLVVEEGLNQLPHSSVSVTTPTGCIYEGIQFTKGVIGVSLCRSGEAMEKALRECCRSIRIGKVLIDSHPQTNAARLLYARLPPEIHKRTLLLLYPIISTGTTVIKAINVLKDNGAKESKIALFSLFCTANAVHQLSRRFPEMTIVCSEIHTTVPSHFGTKYFGTD